MGAYVLQEPRRDDGCACASWTFDPVDYADWGECRQEYGLFISAAATVLTLHSRG